MRASQRERETEKERERERESERDRDRDRDDRDDRERERHGDVSHSQNPISPKGFQSSKHPHLLSVIECLNTSLLIHCTAASTEQYHGTGTLSLTNQLF